MAIIFKSASAKRTTITPKTTGNTATTGRSRTASKPAPQPAHPAAVADAGTTARRRTKPAKPAWKLRVRMYRHGLGDCFLLSFARQAQAPFQMLIDCGALARDKVAMSTLVGRLRDTLRAEATDGRARLDLVVATHEHKDHVSGFNQARAIFNDEIDIGAVWMGWTENLDEAEVRRLKATRRETLDALLKITAGARAQQPGLAPRAADVEALLAFGSDDDTTGTGRVADAMAYLKQRGQAAGDLRFLEPGGAPLALAGVDGVHVYVLGPPKDPSWLKTSAITGRMQDGNLVYSLAAADATAVRALAAAVASRGAGGSDTGQPFAAVHRNAYPLVADVAAVPAELRSFLGSTYDDPLQAWRRIDADWFDGVDQLALDLDNDTNNTSLVLAFEFGTGGDVLLFAADAQIGSWLSWRALAFTHANGRRVSTADLLARCVFYKVGHHCSHNATAKAGGLELMTRADRLTAFIPLDVATAKAQGPRAAGGWDMPAEPLLDALMRMANGRVVLSDTTRELPAAARSAGVVATAEHIDYFLS